ncbi:3143_t:CDS:2 [Dentiscutata heterogama]|uniref:3143_t:CDS:1 n=1 Tax=Dentiscutata heterogama TaxID=1316150 RepID=A0ACA9MDV3_9GLOM|nr:3143_t:CDS:2 [Dentiscutata heterogama]
MRTFSVFWLVRILMFIAVGQLLDCTAIEPFDCSNIKVGKMIFNLSTLNREWNQSIIEKQSKGVMNTTYRINICEPLSYNETLGKNNTCEDGTNICAITTFKSYDSDGDPMIIDVKQIVKNSNFQPISIFSEVNREILFNTTETLEVKLGGGEYLDEKQKANITFFLGQPVDLDPDVVDYKNNTLLIEWKIRATGNDESQGDGSWSLFSIFLFLIFIGFLGYLVIGVAYNYHTYNSHGWDLLPHRFVNKITLIGWFVFETELLLNI